MDNNKSNFNQEEWDALPNNEKIHRIIKLVIKNLLEEIPKNMPDTGKFTRFGTMFEIYGSSNWGVATIEARSSDSSQRIVNLGARRKGTDMLVSNYMKFGTSDEIIKYLSDANTLEEWYQTIIKLSDKVDDKLD